MFLARGTRRDDARGVFIQPDPFQECPLPVVLTLSDTPAQGVFGEGPEVVPLSRVLSIAAGDLKVAKRAITDAIRRGQRRLTVARPGSAASSLIVLSIRQESYQAQFRGKDLSLSARVFRLLVLLAQQVAKEGGGWVLREAIYDALWSAGGQKPRVYLRQVDDTVSQLRNAFNAIEPGSGTQLITARREVGHRLQSTPLQISLS